MTVCAFLKVEGLWQRANPFCEKEMALTVFLAIPFGKGFGLKPCSSQNGDGAGRLLAAFSCTIGFLRKNAGDAFFGTSQERIPRMII